MLFLTQTLADPNLQPQYLLVRPHPSLRIIFVSPSLRIPGLLQSPLLSRIGGPAHVRDGLSDAFESGAAVTAKVTWLPNGRASEENVDASRPGSRRGGATPQGVNGQRTRYISCTPLLGSDDQVGVWMVVMVENELVTGSLASRTAALSRFQNEQAIPPTPSEYQRESTSLEDGDIGGAAQHARFERSNSGYVRDSRRGKVGSEGGALYAEFMRNGGIGKANVDGGGHDYLSGGSGVNGIGNGESRIEEVRSP